MVLLKEYSGSLVHRHRIIGWKSENSFETGRLTLLKESVHQGSSDMVLKRTEGIYYWLQLAQADGNLFYGNEKKQYDIQPGYFGQIRLIGKYCKNMIFAGTN